jgi:hypothetical protein
MSESEKFHEMRNAAETPPKQGQFRGEKLL